MAERLRVLVVDDEPAIVQMVAQRLEHEGFDVVTATDGSQALAVAKTEAPDLILLDLMLPTLNGYDVCAVLKRDPETQRIPVVMFTARTQAADERAGFECGADAYVRKPFDTAKLLQLIGALLAASSKHGAIWPTSGEVQR